MKAKTSEYKFKMPKKQPGQILVVKVGSNERPASSQDLQDMGRALEALKGHPDLTLVTHHAVEFDVIPVEALAKVVVSQGGKK